jgi:acetyl-CoA carboxylase biotin carboxyl carrier protein
MSLSHEDVKRLLELLDASKFDELHLETDGTQLTLRRNGAGPTGFATPPNMTPSKAAPPPPRAAVPQSSAAPQASPASEHSSGLIDIRASMLGLFYSAPKPGAAPFVSVGSKVSQGTAIAIIEVMKLMNSISAGVEGEVVEILACDGELVEFDQVLMRVRPT